VVGIAVRVVPSLSDRLHVGGCEEIRPKMKGPLFFAALSNCCQFEFLELNGVQIEVVTADEKVGTGTFGIAVHWEVKSFDEAFRHLTELGATLYRGPAKIENGRQMCKLKDPFGNLLGLRGL
jgi:hypothetical protein